MAFIVDKVTGLFWKGYGKSKTDKQEKAENYPDSVAHCLLHLFHDEVYILVANESGRYIQHNWAPGPDDRTPLRTQHMASKRLVWVAYNGFWMATDWQALVLGTLLAYNVNDPFKVEPKLA